MEKKSKEAKSILYRMGYCFVAIYTSSLIRILSRLTQMYVHIPCVLCEKVANNYSRTITRLYALIVMGTALLENTSTKDLPMIPKDQLNSFYVGISGRLF
jgi:hypothetical protein